MRKLIIDEQHKEMVNNFIKDGEKGARTRTLGSYDNLVALVEGYKKKLPFIHKNSLQDCRLTIRIGAGDFPNCYKGIPFGTYVSVKFRADGKAELLKVYRENVNGCSGHTWYFTGKALDLYLKANDIVVYEGNENA